MANSFLTAEVIAREALMVLRNNSVMASLVHRDFSREFVAGVGDTITIRKPTTFEAKEFKDNIEIQGISETTATVKLDKHLDVSFEVTSKEMTLGIADFSAQLLVPAMQAFRDKIDGYILELGAGLTNKVAATGDIRNDLIAAREYLTKNAAPLSDRRFVYNSEIESDLLKTDLFVSAEKVGDEGTALREASLGRKFGMDFYVDQNADNTDVQAVAFHKNAFALVTRPLALPRGAENSAIVDYDGLGLRVVYGYDIDKKKDIVSIDLLCGVTTLNAKLASAIVAA